MTTNLFSYIKTHVAILDVISEYTTLKKAGSYWKGACPFHHEKTGSFTVSPHKEIFYCFGCHVHGDVINFIEKVENCTPKEAIKILASRYALDISSYTPSSSGEALVRDQKDFYFDICQVIAQWCHKQWLAFAPLQEYCTRRGISRASCLSFELGYFPGGLTAINQCLSFVQTKGIMPSDLITAGILCQGKTVLYSPFEERLIFPIKDHIGRHCGFGGRIFKEHDTRPKYYNSRENDHFTKGSLLYGFDRAKKKIQETKSAIIVEGYFDCIALAQNGLETAIAILGTACTPSHLKNLSRYVSRLYVLYDSDTAGSSAILRLAEICWQVSIDLFIVTLPPNLDPASFCLQGGAPEKLVQESRDIFLFYTESLGNDFYKKSFQDKLLLMDRFLEAISHLDNRLKQDILLNQTASYCTVSYGALREELDKKIAKNKGLIAPTHSDTSAHTDNTNHNKQPFLAFIEKQLISAIMSNTNLLTHDSASFLEEYLSLPYRDIISLIRRLSSSTGEPVPFTTLYNHLSPEQRQEVSCSLLECETEVNTADFQSLFHQFQKAQWKKFVRDMHLKINKAEAQKDATRIAQLIHELFVLKKRLIQ